VSAIALIAAVARNRVIGGDNQLLWRIKSDLRFFRGSTLGRAVIMGRKTFQSIGKPLPGRLNIVVSRTMPQTEGLEVARSVDEAIVLARKAQHDGRALPDRIMIAGGADIYAQTIDRAERLIITEVDLFPTGDAHFPEIERDSWREASREAHPKGPDDDASHAFVTYVRR
jgi:dihydrofolate reductase